MPAAPRDLEGKLAVVTGATAGIGRACAEQLAARGARLALVARSAAKAQAARDEIARATGNDAIELVIADLASQADVRDAARALLASCERIDLLLNNAGVTNLARETTVDGIETTFAVNHLAYFLLTHELLPRLRATPGARIVSVASDAHRFGGAIDFDDLGLENGYGWTKAYGRSKGANILWTGELARRLEGTGVTANCLHPGFVRSSLGANNGGLGRVLVKVAGVFAMSADKAARYVLDVCTSPAWAGTSGAYFYKGRLQEPLAWARDPERAARLWAVSESMTGVAGSAA